jgi:hypothetical protein
MAEGGERMTKEKKKSTSLRLDPQVLKELKLLAIEQETSIQAIVESLVTEYIKQHKEKS